MQDVTEIIKNVEYVYETNTAFQVLKDFERVIDELDMYAYENWSKGELASGPDISKHWISCTFMWPRHQMPNPDAGKRLLDYDCKVTYKKDHVLVPRKIRQPSDIRPGTKKGKLDKQPIWLVEIKMPKKLIMDIYTGYHEQVDAVVDPALDAASGPDSQAQPGEMTADPLAGGAPAADPIAAGVEAAPVEGAI
jgi:hypothetical protein